MNDFNRAIELYVGWKVSPLPKEEDARVLDHFGQAGGAELLQRVHALIQELQGLQPNWEEYDLVGASKWAVGQLATSHPELSDEGKVALEWIYSWWWK